MTNIKQQKTLGALSKLKRMLSNVAGAAMLSLAMVGGVEAATSQVVYFHTDVLGSPTTAFNASGEVCWRETYSPYGEKLENNDWVAQPTKGCGYLGTDRGHTGHVQDDGGLVYAQQRYYDPAIGRFMSVDPVSAMTQDPRLFGRYHYGGNNPYKYTDPDGQFLVTAGIVVGAWIISDIILPSVLSTEYSNGQVVSAGFPLDAGAALGGVKAGIRGTNALRGAGTTGGVTNGAKLGEFSIVDWKSYPSGVPKPTGPVKLIGGEEYNTARKIANSANRKVRKENNLVGKPVDVHEVQPVKFGGSPTDPANKVIIDRNLHRQQVTPWWNRLQNDVGG